MKHNRLALSICLAVASQAVFANPQGAQVVQGSATFANPSPNVLNISNSRNAVINWQRFNIGQGQTTNFIQPSSSSAVLNRVIGNDPSRILGNLNSNGRVFLINQNGILVGQGAHVNTNGFFGSTLNITDQDFLSGKLKFNGGGQGDINNQGYIHAGADGNIVLIAPNVENGGVIEVEDGNIILAAGKSITITSLQDSALQFEVQSPQDSVTNLGRIIAKNGAAGLFAGTLRHSGAIRADGLVRDANGVIRLVAGDKAKVSGQVQATGGKIEILADAIELQQGANIDASSTAGGGEILIGGDRQGLNPKIKNAASTRIAQGAQVHADGVGNADGGKVIVFASDDVHVQGQVTAKGGAQGGDGGFIETSGKQSLDISAVPDASAANGEGGEWLIDPNNIDIVDSTITTNVDTNILNAGGNYSSSNDNAKLTNLTIQKALNAGTSVTIATGTGGRNTQAGNINVLASILKTQGGNTSLTLDAYNDINIGSSQVFASINITTTSGVMDVSLNPDIDRQGGGQVNFYTGFGNTFSITIDTGGGNLQTGDASILGGNTVFINNTDWVQFGRLEVAGSLSMTRTVGQTQTPGVLDVKNGSYLRGAGSITANVTVNGGAISGGGGRYVPGKLTINGDLTINNGLLYAVIGQPVGQVNTTSWQSSSITANNVAVNGGTLLAVWDGDASAKSATSLQTGTTFTAPPLSLLNCAGTACMTGTGLAAVQNPMLINNSSVLLNSTFGSLNYKINYASDIVHGANIVTWLPATGPGANNSWNNPARWSGGQVPAASDYVFLSGGDVPPAVTLASSQTVAGFQSFDLLRLNANAKLTVNGPAYVAQALSGYPGILSNDTTASLSGTGPIYLAPGSTNGWYKGISQVELHNWGRSSLLSGGGFTNNALFFNDGLLLIDDTAGLNTLNGTGGLRNNLGIIRAFADFSSNLDFTNTSLGRVEVIGSGVKMTLAGSSSLDGKIDMFAGSSLTLQGGVHNFASGLNESGQMIFAGGTYSGVFNQLTGNNLDITAVTSDVIFDALTLVTNGTVKFSSAGNKWLLNNGSIWTNHGTADFINTASGATVKNDNNMLPSVVNATGATMNISPSTRLDFFTPFDNQGTLNVTGTSVFASHNPSTQSGTIDIANGATYMIASGTNSALTLSGTPVISGSGLFLVDANATFDVAATVAMAPALTLQMNTGSVIKNIQKLTIPNTFNALGGGIGGPGTFTTPAGSTSTINVLSVQNLDWTSLGTLKLSSGSQLGLQSGATLNLNSGSNFNGSTGGLLKVDGGRLNVNTPTDLKAVAIALQINSGNAQFSQNVSAADLSLNGILTNTASLNVTRLDWLGGVLQGAGNTSVSGQTNLPGSTPLTLDSQILTLQGPTSWKTANSNLDLRNAAVINNKNVFTDTSTSTIRGTGTFNNSGSYVAKSTASSTLALPFNNTGGTLNVQTGTLNIDNSFNGGTVSLANGAVLGGGGSLNVASLTLNGATVSGLPSVTANTVFTAKGNSQLINTTLLHAGEIAIPNATDRLVVGNSTHIISGSGASFTGKGTLDLKGTGSDWKIIMPWSVTTLLTMPTTMTLEMNGGQLINAERLGFPGTVNVHQALFQNNSAMTIPAGTTFNYLAQSDVNLQSGVNNFGKIIVNSPAAVLNLVNTALNNQSGASFSIKSPTALKVKNGFLNDGTLNLDSGSSFSVETGGTLDIRGTVTGTGNLRVNGGTMNVYQPVTLPSTLSFELAAGQINSAENLVLNGSFNWLNGTVNGAASGFTSNGLVALNNGILNTDWLVGKNSSVSWIHSSQSMGNATLSGTGTLHNQGALDINGNVRLGTAFNNDGGKIMILSGSSFGLKNGADLKLDQAGEKLSGYGTFEGNVINQAGRVTPGSFESPTTGSTGQLTINGDFTQGAAGTTFIKLDSTFNGLHNDVLNVAGQLNAGGAIDFKLINGSGVVETAALIDQHFKPLRFGSFAGKFASSSVPAGLNFTLSPGGVIRIGSDNPLLNTINNQLQVLSRSGQLNHTKMARVMRLIDQKGRLIASIEKANKDKKAKKRGPRLVCK